MTDPRDGTCPGCGDIVCYLLPEDQIWRHAKPEKVYSETGAILGDDGRKFDVTYPICSGSGNKAVDAYTPVNFNPDWHKLSPMECRMILKPEFAKTMRKISYKHITG